MTESVDDRARALMKRLDDEAEKSGYHLNPDAEITLDICRGLVMNFDRYEYMACPCRLADGVADLDRDIVCPCDYRDADLGDFGACYCALYVNDAIKKGDKQAEPIPERRPPPDKRSKSEAVTSTGAIRVYRCKVCGYLCAREAPPEVCPICKAKKDRFEPFNPSP